MDEIKENMNQLRFQLGNSEPKNCRIRRGMFDTIGEAAKILFGTMDHDNAMYYDDKIKKVSYIQYELSILEKEEAAVMISTIKTINKTNNEANMNQDKIITSFDKILEFQNLTQKVLNENLII